MKSTLTFHLFVCTIMFPIARSSRERRKKTMDIGITVCDGSSDGIVGSGCDRHDDQHELSSELSVFLYQWMEYLLVWWSDLVDFHFFFFSISITQLRRFASCLSLPLACTIFRLTNLKTSILRTYSFGSRRFSGWLCRRCWQGISHFFSIIGSSS